MNPKTKILKFTLAILSLTWLVGCGSASLDNHASTTPELKLETFFNGELKAYGMVLDRSGDLLRRFDVKLIATWEGNNGVIKEWFFFADGERSTRVWNLIKTGENTYTGTANDVVGTAYGETQGSALYWKYDLEIEVDGSTYEVVLDDWMFLMDEKRLFNKTEMSKFGFKVGEVILYIEKI
ncbi:hypothetical protein OAW_02880 [Vibrio cyclitrophicus ZF170]|uniref:DUF3833 domain-containing protein n=1 Tax=Vibrio cyclitrophicus TaxID=47951 RepID=UPI0003106915|nr:DUF3833 domain-containing protein [Vibrio cyclitrophicus]OEE20899.1 hypothetical protein OAW_02880 [Vibrio cyclitrophicus ZF170]